MPAKIALDQIVDLCVSPDRFVLGLKLGFELRLHLLVRVVGLLVARVLQGFQVLDAAVKSGNLLLIDHRAVPTKFVVLGSQLDDSVGEKFCSGGNVRKRNHRLTVAGTEILHLLVHVRKH
jgi:hypothetical protein